MIEDAIKYQTQGEDRVERVLVGGGVLAVGVLLFFLVVPLVAFLTFNGYLLEVVRRVMRGETTNPPGWGELDLVDVTVDGLRHALVMLGYGLALVVVAGLPVVLLGGIGLAADSGLVSGLGLLAGLGLYSLGALAFQVVAPIATGNFVLEDRIGAGFDLGVVRDLATNRTLLVAVLYGFLVNVGMGAVTTVLGLTLVGYLAVPWVVFVGQSAIYYVWARGFADAYREEYGELPAVPDGPVKPGVDVTPAEPSGTDGVGGATDEAPLGSQADPTTADTPDDIVGDRDDENRGA